MQMPNVKIQSKTILVTGAAGFIGSSLVNCILFHPFRSSALTI